MEAATPADASMQPLKVLHVVSGPADSAGQAHGVLLPLLMRGDKRTVQNRVVHLSTGHPHATLVRQAGVPVHEVRLSRKGVSALALRDLVRIVRMAAPDVVHAWGQTAVLVAVLLRRLAAREARLVASFAGNEPLKPASGAFDRVKFRAVVRAARWYDDFVYASDTARTRHWRAGLPESRSTVIAQGVDVERYRPDVAARKRVRDKLELADTAFAIGMVAPFQAESDHVTFFKAVGDVLRANPHAVVLLAGRGVQRGNAPLMALVGGGALASRVRLLGEWSDLSGLFNACDVIVSTAHTDDHRLTIATAMLCGVPCVATALGGQGEVMGRFGITIEPGGEASLARGLHRIEELAPDRRLHMVRIARQHILQRFNQMRSVWRYQMLYLGVETSGADAAAGRPAHIAKPAGRQLTAA